MNPDDDLRRALNKAAPPMTDPTAARAGLTPAMRRARARRRARLAAGGGTLAVALIGGSLLLIDRSDTSEVIIDAPIADGGAPDLTDEPTTTAPSIAIPAPTTTAPSPVVPSTPTDPAPPPTAAPVPTTTPPPPSAIATTTTLPVPTTTPIPTTTPGSPTQYPATTPCGSVVFVHDGATLEATAVTDQPGYTHRVSSEKPTELDVEWFLDGEDACKAEAKLEDDGVRVETEP